MASHISNVRPEPDKVLTDIADYVTGYEIKSDLAYATARNCLIDTLGCGLEALEYPACTKLLGPDRARAPWCRTARKVPGTQFQLDPVQAAFNIGAMIRWLDFNDTWLAAEWGHPSDNLGGILATADWLSRTAVAAGKPPLTMRDVLTGMIKAHEIQGCIALENSFNRVGLDHVVLVKVASTAVVAHMLGLTRDEIINAVSLAWVDGQSLRTYRHAPNTGSRKMLGGGRCDQPRGAPRADRADRRDGLSVGADAPRPGAFTTCCSRARPFKFQRPYGSYVMENVLFKISFPAEFHSQTAVEAAMTLHASCARKASAANDIEKHHHPHARGLHPHHRQAGPARQSRRPRPLHPVHGRRAADLRPADRRRLRGRRRRRSAHRRAARQDRLRRRPRLTRATITTRRSARSPTRCTVELKDGTTLTEVAVEYPIGHRRRRAEGIPLLEAKFRDQPRAPLPGQAAGSAFSMCRSIRRALEAMPVHEYVDLYVI